MDQTFIKTIIGKQRYMFLFEDRNGELEYHFTNKSDDYTDSIENLIQMINWKNGCSCPYSMHVVPDKSVVCYDLLPSMYDPSHLFRLTQHTLPIHDLLKDTPMDASHFFRSDSHMNFKGAELLTCSLIRQIFDADTADQMIHHLDTKTVWTAAEKRYGDLLSPINFGEMTDEKALLMEECVDRNVQIPEMPSSEDVLDMTLDIPEPFRFVFSRANEHYRCMTNPHRTGKILFLCDSSTMHFMKYFLIQIFDESFFVWDHWIWNQHMIDWYQPDRIIEIRTERFLTVVPPIEHWTTVSWNPTQV